MKSLNGKQPVLYGLIVALILGSYAFAYTYGNQSKSESLAYTMEFKRDVCKAIDELKIDMRSQLIRMERKIDRHMDRGVNDGG